MGPYLSQANTQKESYQGSYQNMVWAASAMQGWRNNMEDAHIHETNIDGKGTSIFGIFDGHGGNTQDLMLQGKEVAIFVQRHFVEELKKFNEFSTGNYSKALELAFFKMDDMIETESGKQELHLIKNGLTGGDNYRGGGDSYAGCTANVCIIANNKLYCANAGDSRSVLGMSNDSAFPMSIDHKPDDDIEKKRIMDAGGYVTEGRVNGNLNLSRALGDMEYKSQKERGREKQLISPVPDLTVKELDNSVKFILMGCDGIWECMTNEELIKFCSSRLAQKQDAKSILEQLLDKIVAPDTSNGIGCDNMSTILVVLN